MRFLVKLSVIVLCLNYFNSVHGQPLSDGMAIITNKTGSNINGFSGFSSHSFQIFDAGNNLTAPIGQNWEPTFYTPSDPSIYAQWEGANMGDVFGIAIDDQKNVYFATSCSFSPFNSGSAGSGGVYKMNADDWSISTFITTGNANNQIPNQNVGLGNICFDKWHNQLLITNFEDGKIYRYDMEGNFLSSFDPFNSDDGNAGLPGLNEAIWGINVFGTDATNVKVYFSRWGDDIPMSVWSVDMDATGEFSNEESFCLNIPNSNPDIPISDITFSADGKMYVCENTIKKYTEFNFFENMAHQSMVFEYSLISDSWIKTQNYFVGNYSINRNSTGGVSLGNRQTKNGIECEGLVWTTGDALKFNGQNINEFDTETVYGVAGIPLTGNTEENVITTSIYIDTDVFGDGSLGEKKFFMGDIEIYSDPNSLSTLTISPTTTICNGESVQLNVTGGSNYEWSPSLTLDNSNSANPTATPTETTTYTVTDGASGGCGSTANVTINVDDFSISLGPNIVTCILGQEQTFDAGADALSYLWSTGETTQTINTITPGDYSVNVISPAGCNYEDEITLELDDFSFSLGPDILNCNNESEQTFDAGSDGVSYLWSTGETTQSVSVLNTGVFSVNVTSPAGCDYQDEVSIINAQPPILAFSTPKDSLCPNETFNLIDQSIPVDSDPIVAWNWQVNGNSYTTENVNIELQNSGNYSVSLEITSELGCVKTISLDDYLYVYESPEPEFITEPEELNKCDKTIQLINLSSDYEALQWNLGDGFISNEDTINSYTYSELGDYTIGLSAVNEFGCEKTYFNQIIPESKIPFYAPNAFTPNANDLNEIFIPLLACHDNFQLWIYNQWGENIFYSNAIEKGWDGTYKGNLSPIGVYYWKATYDGAKNDRLQTGEVHLMH
jgi:gliding motility-associated-like protein